MQVSSSIYNQSHNRMRVRCRGAVVGLIHARCLTMRDGVYDDSAAVTHMSSDAGLVETFPWYVQESWAQIVEVLLGMGCKQYISLFPRQMLLISCSALDSIRLVVPNAHRFCHL